MRHLTPLQRFADQSLVIRATIALACFALALAGCGSVMPGSVVGDAGGGAVVMTGLGPGVDDDTVKVVFVGVDLDAVKAVTGFKTASAGDPEKQVEALEAWVNANGGVGGRKLDAVFRLYDAQNDSAAAEESLCKGIVQDDKAFAVVLTGQFQENARPCYAQAQTLVLDATLVATDDATYKELAPYLWSPSYPSYDSFVRAFVKTLSEQAFFEGRNEVGVVAADNAINRATMEDLAIPLLKDAGVKAEVVWIDSTSQSSLMVGTGEGAVTFRSKGIDRVMFLGGARMASLFATQAESKEFKARYAISTFDNPTFFINNPDLLSPSIMKGMVGVGFAPSQEVADDQLAFPGTDAEQKCADIYAEAGIAFESREAARVAMPYCDAALLLQAGSTGLTDNFNAGAWGAAVEKLGSAFVPATGFTGSLGPGRHAASGAYRVLKFDDACGCFVYEGGDVDFPTS
ncbi:ABC transporter substrate-binding protein [Mumia zhuanghuii]|uniref:ABC transporter substrate-binding protein n=2 Tax=Mumia TaxID=1546255 RepID=A0ABW1QP10_9ACTN|nr:MULTISPECIES: ABC transporter substrate-binding protein [Mumia]KAA1420498.1 ABC transporter substrate-binding protein [Mumia zhuanghuii]